MAASSFSPRNQLNGGAVKPTGAVATMPCRPSLDFSAVLVQRGTASVAFGTSYVAAQRANELAANQILGRFLGLVRRHVQLLLDRMQQP